MAKKIEVDGKIEREYLIPLRKKVKIVPRYKKANKAIRTIKEFLVRHMKIRDRDLNKVKIDKYLNEAIWSRGIRHPPHKIKVKAIKEPDKDIVRVELAELSGRLKFKKAREDKTIKQAKEIVQSKKTMMEKAKEAMAPAKTAPESEAKAEESKEKERTSAEATMKLEQAEAKKSKHEAKEKSKEPKHQFRQALQK